MGKKLQIEEEDIILRLPSRRYNSKTYSYFFRFYIKLIYGIKINNLLCELSIENVFLKDLAIENSSIDDMYFYIVVNPNKDFQKILSKLKKESIFINCYPVFRDNKPTGQQVIQLKFYDCKAFKMFKQSKYSKMFDTLQEEIASFMDLDITVVHPETNKTIYSISELNPEIDSPYVISYYLGEITEQEAMNVLRHHSAVVKFADYIGCSYEDANALVKLDKELVSKINWEDEEFDSSNYVDKRYPLINKNESNVSNCL